MKYSFNRKKHLEKLAKQHTLEYSLSSKRRLFRRYNHDAKNRNLKFNLTFEKFINLVLSNCYYCGSSPSNIVETKKGNGSFVYNGIDRLDNNKGYTNKNCVTCCKICNHAKARLSQQEFVNWLKNASSFVSGNRKKYSLLIGRYQCLPPHKGHQTLIDKLLNEGKNVLIALRKEDGTKNNPYTQLERQYHFTKIYKKEIRLGKVKIVNIPDIEEVCWGRGVGWGRREIRLDEKTEAISATKLRKERKK